MVYHVVFISNGYLYCLQMYSWSSQASIYWWKATCYHFSYISVHFVFINLLVKIHTCFTDNFNRSSALAESIFSKLLHLPKSIYREKYSFCCCIRDRKGCNKFHVLKKLGKLMLKVLHFCVYSLYRVTRYKVFLIQKVQIQPFIKVGPISAWENLKSQHFFPQRRRLIQGKLSYLLWNWVSNSNPMYSKSQHTSLNEIIFRIFFLAVRWF